MSLRKFSPGRRERRGPARALIAPLSGDTRDGIRGCRGSGLTTRRWCVASRTSQPRPAGGSEIHDPERRAGSVGSPGSAREHGGHAPPPAPRLPGGFWRGGWRGLSSGAPGPLGGAQMQMLPWTRGDGRAHGTDRQHGRAHGAPGPSRRPSVLRRPRRESALSPADWDRGRREGGSPQAHGWRAGPPGISVP